MRGKIYLTAALAVMLPASAVHAQVTGSDRSAATSPSAAAVLPAGTPVVVSLNDNLSSKTHKVGDPFKVTVVSDVIDRGVVVIPKGTTGFGEVTFSTDKGGFGRAGILGIALRYLDLNGHQFALDGRYREEGKDNGAAAGAVVFMVGIFGAAVSGKTSIIPKGRELKARTGDDIPLTWSAAPAANAAAAASAPSSGGPTVEAVSAPSNLTPGK